MIDLVICVCLTYFLNFNFGSKTKIYKKYFILICDLNLERERKRKNKQKMQRNNKLNVKCISRYIYKNATTIMKNNEKKNNNF